MFEKTKQFIKDHRTEIAVVGAVAATAVVCMAGAYCGRKIEAKRINSDPAMKAIFEVLYDIPEGTPIRVYHCIHPVGIKPAEFAKLGEDAIAKGADALNDAFTHFIAIKKLDT